MVGGGVAAVALSSGSDDDTAGPPPAPSSSPSPTTSSSTSPPTAFADQPAPDILSAAQSAMAGLDSVRISGDVLDGGDLLGVDLAITSSGDCDGTISSGGGSAELRRIGGDTWFLADEAFWIASTDATQGPLIAATVDGRWVSVPAADAEEFATVCDLDGLLSSTTGTGVGRVLGPGTVEGRAVVRVETGGDPGGEAGVAAVAVDDPHYILELDNDSDGAFVFSDFDRPFAAQPPPSRDVFDLPGLD